MKKQTTATIINAVVIVLMVLTIGGVVMGISHTTNQLALEVKDNNVEAVLASANVENNATVTVPVLYYDQKMDSCVDLYNVGLQNALEKRQFEWADCGYYGGGFEVGLVEAALDDQYLPVAVGGNLLPNRGLSGGFNRWFNQVDGQSKSYAGAISLVYDANSASFKYDNKSFYPIDSINLAAEESVNKDGHNHLFTMNLGIPFQVLADGREVFSVTADDDTWVFIDDTLVLDMGGIHRAMTGGLKINESGEVYGSVDGEDFAYTGVKLSEDEGSIVRVFHADRDSEDSVFSLSMVNMMPKILNTTLADSGEVEIAYDPSDPSYVAPLGESLTVRPNRSKPLVTAVAVQMMTVGGLGVLLILAISVAYRCSRRDRNQEE